MVASCMGRSLAVGAAGVIAAAVAGCGSEPGPAPGPAPGPEPAPPAETDPFTTSFDYYFAEAAGELACGNESGYTWPPTQVKGTTIVDIDVPKLFCDTANQSAPCTFIHMFGKKSACATPTPPDMMHRYLKISYSASCSELDNVNGAATIDGGGVKPLVQKFDPMTGVLKSCEKDVIRASKNCFEPVASTGTEFPQNVEGYKVREVTGPRCGPYGTNPMAGKCDDYFGSVEDNAMITIVDRDVPALFCALFSLTAPCVFVHKVGSSQQPGKGCQVPTPPDASHQYDIVTYSSDCAVLALPAQQDLVATCVATDTLFNTDGVLKACSGDVVSNVKKCYAPIVPTMGEFPFHIPGYRVQESTCTSVQNIII